jgi:hypothetical protein
MVEDIKGYRLLDIPEKLIERYHPQDVKDIYEGMTGFEFIYTLVSLGLSVEQQSKIIDLYQSHVILTRVGFPNQ